MLVDSHCHLNYLDHPEAALQRARQQGVEAFLCIGVERGSIDQVLALAAAHADVWATVGEHPSSCSGDAGWVEDYVNTSRVVALGEMGLDYFHTREAAAQAGQRHTFTQQMALAAQCGLPVVIHTRAAQADTLAIMAAEPGVVGVLHCFTESWEMARQALEMGYFISLSGIVTFKNADNVREVARKVPLERLLIETDAPWLAPVPVRGQPNEPAFVCHTAAFIADLRNMPLHELVEQTGRNFVRLFNAVAGDGGRNPESD